jgi:hypothetical protein
VHSTGGSTAAGAAALFRTSSDALAGVLRGFAALSPAERNDALEPDTPAHNLRMTLGSIVGNAVNLSPAVARKLEPEWMDGLLNTGSLIEAIADADPDFARRLPPGWTDNVGILSMHVENLCDSRPEMPREVAVSALPLADGFEEAAFKHYRLTAAFAQSPCPEGVKRLVEAEGYFDQARILPTRAQLAAINSEHHGIGALLGDDAK